VIENPAPSAPVDWAPLFELAGLDRGQLQDAEPLWSSLAASDVRVAWTGTWPGTTRPLRVEASALGGRPVSFQLVGPWTKPWRTASSSGDGGIGAMVVFVLALAILAGGALLAARNLREGRGDRTGALRLGAAIGAILWAVWVCQVHPTPSIGLLGMFLIAVVTTVFYAVIFWALYLALEPFVRRYWPQTLVSWTTILGGRLRDPIVGRDVLIGILLGVSTTLIVTAGQTFAAEPLPSSTEYLLGLRSTAGRVLIQGAYAIRSGLVLLFLLFLLRVVLRNHWLAALGDHRCVDGGGVLHDVRDRSRTLGAYHTRRWPDDDQSASGRTNHTRPVGVVRARNDRDSALDCRRRLLGVLPCDWRAALEGRPFRVVAASLRYGHSRRGPGDVRSGIRIDPPQRHELD
jgi:hypothetical protein